MAKQVKEPEFRTVAKSAQYPWSQWLNGDCLLLEVGTDFGADVTPRKMAALAKKAGRKVYKLVQVSTKDANGDKIDGGLIIKARDMSDSERAAEDQRRKDRKAIAKAKRAARKAAAANGSPA